MLEVIVDSGFELLHLMTFGIGIRRITEAACLIIQNSILVE